MRKFLACWSLAALCSLATGCMSPEATVDEEGQAVVEEGQADLNFASVLPELEGSGIKGTVRKLVDPRLNNLSAAEDKYYLEVRLGRLSLKQFDQVKALFGGHTRVAYNATRDYELTDFLHPAMQAITNQVYTPDSLSGAEKLSDESARLQTQFTTDEDMDALFGFLKNGVSVMTNCYGTTAELLRQLRPGATGVTYNLYFPDRGKAHKWFTDPMYSDVVAAEKHQFGDALVVQLDKILAHTALVLSKELVFEKVDVTKDDPYRISLRSDVLAKYERIGEERDELKYEVRRFGANKTELPAPTADVSPALAKELTPFFPGIDLANVTLAKDLNGMGGGDNPQFNEIKPAKVIIHPPTGRGILQAPQTTLKRFVGLKGR